jgi:glycosyltransferase involved in cell wall biosynthesis
MQNKTGIVFDKNKKLYDRYTSISDKDELLSLVKSTKLESSKANILAYIHLYVPKHNAGSETMMHQVLLEMKRRGHNVRVVCGSPEVESYEGIDIYDINKVSKPDMFDWSDIVFTHLDFTEEACRIAKIKRKPVVHFLHHGRQVQIHKINKTNASLIVANSEWIKTTASHLGVPMLTLYPPTDPKDYRVDNKSAKAITLVNLNDNKGGTLFWDLARILPDVSFIGVKGAYDKQVLFDGELPNVTLYDNDPDIKKIYAQTKVIIMPSALESWGRVGMEAAASGIPTIANPTPGLMESLGDAGTFVDRTNLVGYVEEIRKLLSDTEHYSKKSKQSIERSKEVHESFARQIDKLEESLSDLF